MATAAPLADASASASSNVAATDRIHRLMQLALAEVSGEYVVSLSPTEHLHCCAVCFQAEEAYKGGEVPVGCVFVVAGTETVLGAGANETNVTANVLSHPPAA